MNRKCKGCSESFLVINNSRKMYCNKPECNWRSYYNKTHTVHVKVRRWTRTVSKKENICLICEEGIEVSHYRFSGKKIIWGDHLRIKMFLRTHEYTDPKICLVSHKEWRLKK